MSSTHEVSNQAPPLENYNLFDRNRPLIEAVEREGAADASGWLAERGAEIGSDRHDRAWRRGESQPADAQALRSRAGAAATRSNSIPRITS